jgi:Xaa-Pro dipeptidase
MQKIDALKKSATQQDIANFLIFNSTNLIYFTGFNGATALLIPQDGENTLYVSAVNYEQAKAETKNFKIELLKRGENLMEKIANQTKTSPKKIAIDTLSIESYRALAKAVGGEEKLEACSSLIRELRQIKDKTEIALIREACKLANLGMQVAYETIKPGVSELEVAAEVEYAMRKKGSQGTSFDTIVASGANSAYPHGSCSNRIIQSSDFVVVDLGATFNFYRSDMTRTFTAGKPTSKQARIYETVKNAQEKAFQTIKPQVLAKKVDAEARRIIDEAGYGELFVHNLGHGVGLEVHEPPTLSPDSKDLLKAGYVVTDEPGIYIAGYGGVRIEDTILVTEDGAEKLTNGHYSLTGK